MRIKSVLTHSLTRASGKQASSDIIVVEPRPQVEAFRNLDRLDLEERESHHLQQHPTMTEPGDLRLAIGARGVPDREIHRFQVELRCTEDQIEIAERTEIAEIGLARLEALVVAAPHHLRAAQRV